MIPDTYKYSIEVARRIYQHISDDAEALEVCMQHIEHYYKQKGIAPKKDIQESQYSTYYRYTACNQCVTLSVKSDKKCLILLNQYDDDTNRLVEEAYYKKEIFGLPVHWIIVMEDGPQVYLDLMSKSDYINLDTTHAQVSRQMNFVQQINYAQRITKLTKAAYDLAEVRGFLRKGIKTFSDSISRKGRYISENIIRKTWDYHEAHRTYITDGQETRLIMQNCIYAGMLSAESPEMDVDFLLSILEKNNITRIEQYVENHLGFRGVEFLETSCIAKGLVEDVYNDNTHLYDYETTDGRWEYYRDVACVMFQLGALYYINRSE